MFKYVDFLQKLWNGMNMHDVKMKWLTKQNKIQTLTIGIQMKIIS